MRKLGRLFLSLFYSCLILLAFTSCELFSNDLKGFLEYYSGSAAVGKVEFPETVGTATNGLVCVDSEEDKEFKLLLRNPQGYGDGDITLEYKFNNPELNDIDVYPFITLNDDLLTATMIFPQYGLEIVDKGLVKDDDDNLVKDLSGVCRIFANFSSSYFREEYPVNFMVNSAPERIRGAMFQLDGEKNSNPNYVIAFNVRKLTSTVHDADTHDIYIDNNHWTFSKDFSVITEVSVEPGCSLSTTSPATLYDADGRASSFQDLSADGYIPLYFTSNEKNDGSSKVVTSKISIVDDFGLDTKATVVSVPYKLQPPEFSSLVEGKTVYPAEEGSEEFKFTISHSGETFYIDEGGNQKQGDNCENPIIIEYAVKKDGVVVKKGVKQAPVTISLPSSTGYTVDAYAYSDGFLDSIKTTSEQFGVSRSNIYYVSKDGSNIEGTGSKDNPYNSISACLDVINNQIVNFGKNDTYIINLLSNLTDSDSLINITNAHSFLENTELTIQGYDKACGLGCTGEDSAVISVYEANDMTLKLNNLIITSKQGAGIEINTSHKVDLELEEVTVKNCRSSSDYSGIYFNVTSADPGILSLSNSTVENNTTSSSTVKGAGINLANGRISIKNKVVVKDNLLVISDRGVLQASNLYLGKDGSNQKVINIIGELSSESEIGVTCEKTPTIGYPVFFTSDFSAHNTNIAPSSIFTSDKGYGVSWTDVENQTGEACIAVSGGAFGIDFKEKLSVQADAQYCYYGRARTVNLSVGLINDDDEFVPFTDSQFSNATVNTRICVSGETLVAAQSGKQITIPASLEIGKYTLKTIVVYNGKAYNFEFPLECVLSIEGLEAIPTSGTWQVSTKLGMKTLSEWTAAGNSFENVTFELNNDISVGSDFTPIGKSTNKFAGHFNGKGHSVKNLNVNSLNGNYGALFGYVEGNAIIENVTTEGRCDAAGIVGSADGENVIVRNCINKATISDLQNAVLQTGGIVAEAGGSLLIENCINDGNITSSKYIGGILAYYHGDGELIIRNCVNRGNLTETNSRMPAGGIAGQLFASSHDVIINNNYNSGQISGGTGAGIVAINQKIYCSLNNNLEIGTGYNDALINSNVSSQTVSNKCFYNYYTVSNPGSYTGTSYKISLASGQYFTSSDVTVNSNASSKDLITLLNYWVDDKNTDAGEAVYKHWAYDEEGRIVFVE